MQIASNLRAIKAKQQTSVYTIILISFRKIYTIFLKKFMERFYLSAVEVENFTQSDRKCFYTDVTVPQKKVIVLYTVHDTISTLTYKMRFREISN